jgi:hypothetical protein
MTYTLKLRQAYLLFITLAIWASLLAGPNSAHAISRTLVSGSAICDQTETACFDGSITWYKNRKDITINGRLKRAVEPGELIFMFSGHLTTGEQVFHTQKIEIRGKRGEIIDARFKPPFSNQTIWALHQLTYTPDDTKQ